MNQSLSNLQKDTSVNGHSRKWLNWENVCKCSVALWVIAQVVLIVIYWDVSQRSDQGSYMNMATRYFNKGAWYPDMSEIYSSYIWAPGLINFFILQLKIFGTLKANYFINLLMNIGILYNVWYLSDRFFSKRTAYIAVTFFCWMFSNVMVVLPAGTEVPFLFLALSAFSLSLSNRSLPKLFLAGLLLALANWIRPLSAVYVLVILFYLFVKKSRIQHYAALLVPLVVLTLSFGWMAQRQIGYFKFQSTTSGINLIMTANDKAYGGVATSLSSDSTTTVYIRNSKQYTFVQKDSIWMARSMEWIKAHPVKFAGLYVAKLAGLHVEDSWADRPILGGDGFVDKAAHGKADKMAIVKRVWNMFSKSIIYYIVLILSFVAILKYRKDIISDKGYILLIWLLGTLMTCIFSVSPRYHYPFLFALIIWAAYGVDKYIIQKEERRTM